VTATDRQRYALAHPATGPADVLNPRLVAREPVRGGLLSSILAVDR
jgi:hypothetical protein